MSAHTFDLAARPHQAGSLMSWLAGREGALQRAGVRNEGETVSSADRDGMLDLFAPINSSAGVPVNDRTSMQVATLYACLSKIGGVLTQAHLQQYRMKKDGHREELGPNDLWYLLNESPSPNWTSASWKEWIVNVVYLRGDQITEILRNGAKVAGFRPLLPDAVKWRLVEGRLRYDVIDLETGRTYGLDQDDVLHFPGFAFNGVRSLSVIQYAARQALGNSMRAADFAGRTLGEGAMPQIALTYPNKMDRAQTKLLRDSFVSTYGGTQGRKLPLILTEGGEVHELSITPVDLELMAMRDFEKEEICEACGVPPIILGNSKKASTWGQGIEQIILGFVRFTIKPLTQRWQEELNRKLYRRAGTFVEFDLDALQSGDSKAQAAAFRAALGGPGNGDAWMSVNEVRRIKNLPPVAGGNVLFKAADAKGAASAAPAKDDPTEDDDETQAAPAAA